MAYGIATAPRTPGTGAGNYAQGNHTHLLAGGATDATITVANLNKAVRGYAAGSIVIGGTITLNGANPTPVVFAGADQAATITGTADEPFALDNGLTLVVDPDGAGDDTFTFAAAAATSVSAAAPATDLTALTTPSFKVSVDGGAVQAVTLTAASCDTGAHTATEIQTKLQALGGAYASVTCAYTTVYTITSATKGTASHVIITNADANNCADELKLGAANGGTETAGTGDAANIAAATAAEVAAAISADASGWSATAVGTKVRIDSDTTGGASTLTVNAASTADTVLGITGTDRGAEGLSAANMANTSYVVTATLSGVSSKAADVLSIGGKAVSGFNVYAETDANAGAVDLIVFGTPA